MENRSKKVPLSKRKNQLSCMWGLAEMFDFRNNQKLLTNGKNIHKHNSDAEHLRKVAKKTSVCEKCQNSEDDACKIKVKDIIREEYPSVKQLKKQLKALKERQMRGMDFGCIHQSAKGKTAQKASQMMQIGHTQEKMLIGGTHQCWRENESCLDSFNFTTMLEEICSSGNVPKSIATPRFKHLDEINLQLLQMNAKAFIDQIYINRRYATRAADMDDKSTTHLQKLQFPKREKDKREVLSNPKSSECQSSVTNEYGDPECTMRIQKKNMKNTHLWKRLIGFSFKGSACSHADAIVVLQPASKRNVPCHCSGVQSHQSLNSKGQNIKPTYFSLKEIKRKFKQAVGESRKDKHLISVDNNRISHRRHSLTYAEMRISHSASPRESTHSDDFERVEKQQKPLDVSKRFNSLSRSGSKRDQVDIFTEGKRHLSERLKRANVGEILQQKQALKTLEMILSSPHSPKGYMSASVSEPMRSSENGKGSFQKQNEEVQPHVDFRFDSQLVTSESKANVLKRNSAATELHESIDIAGEDLKPRGHVSIIPEENKSIETSESSEDNGNECSNLADFPKSDPFSTPLDISSLQTLDICKDREGHPSPVSVLEPFSSEDINSPTSTAHDPPAGSPLQPRHIDFNDQLNVDTDEDSKINIATCLEGEDYISAYVRAVMQASELSFENLSTYSSPSVLNALNSYLSNSVGLFQEGTNSELNLLLDCIHEVLVEVYHRYFGCPPYLSFLKPISRSIVPLEADVVELVMKEVDYHLFPEMAQPVLDRLVCRDIAKSASWFVPRAGDTEAIVIEIAEDVLQDAVMDAILEFQI